MQHEAATGQELSLAVSLIADIYRHLYANVLARRFPDHFY